MLDNQLSRILWEILLVALTEELGPVLDGARHHAGVNEVKGVVVVPLVFYVFDIELYVWRNSDVGIIAVSQVNEVTAIAIERQPFTG